MLNWHRDPGYEQRVMQHEQRMSENRIAIERSKERTKQIESEILRVRNDSELIEKEILRVKNDSELIEKDTEQIEKETEQLRRENAREKAFPHYQERCHPSQSQTRGLDGAEQCVVTARRSRLMSEGG
jgi:septal ring factor EnvC (AmiA/AmiB activator)